MTIHAYTQSGSCPAYVNLSKRVACPGDVILTVRTAGENGASSIILDRGQAAALAHDILRHYRAPTPDVKAAVDRFLGWKLPETFSPDCGISFDGRKDDEWNKNKCWPVGTNLFNAEEARAMFEHVLHQPAPGAASSGNTALPPHQQRVIDEKRELDDKGAKLEAFFKTSIFAGLDSVEKDRLLQQSAVMATYSDILGERIAAFQVVPA
jgi:hypothetical protein